MIMDKSQVLSLLIANFSFLSIVSSLYVCISNDMKQYKPCGDKGLSNETESTLILPSDISSINKYKKPSENIHKKYVIFIDVIFWMCIMEFIHGLHMFFVWTPQIFTHQWLYDNYGITCILLGMIGNFASTNIPLWHMLLAYHLVYILRGYSVYSLSKQKKYHYIVIATVKL